MLSEKEAVHFAQSTLDIGDILGKVKKSRLDALNEIIKSYHQKIPFQNITLLAKEPGTTTIPSLEEIKLQVLSGEGGLCYTNNVFMHYLLEALGYHVNFIAGDFRHPNNHILVYCRLPGGSVSSGLLVDVGCGSSTFEAIPISEATVCTPVYSGPHSRYRYLKMNDGTFQRQHHYEDDWHLFHKLDLTPRGLDHFSNAMERIYCRAEAFLRKYRVSVFSETGMRALKEEADQVGKATYVELGNVQERVEEDVATDEDLLTRTSQLLPRFEKGLIKEAIKNWQFYQRSLL